MGMKETVKVDKQCAYHHKLDNSRCQADGVHKIAPGKGVHTFYFCDEHFPTAREAATMS